MKTEKHLPRITNRWKIKITKCDKKLNVVGRKYDYQPTAPECHILNCLWLKSASIIDRAMSSVSITDGVGVFSPRTYQLLIEQPTRHLHNTTHSLSHTRTQYHALTHTLSHTSLLQMLQFQDTLNTCESIPNHNQTLKHVTNRCNYWKRWEDFTLMFLLNIHYKM